MKKFLSSLLLFLGVCMQVSPVFASPSDKEVETLANKLGWTKDDLEEYLTFKGLNVEDFDNIHILEKQLGTPITPTNLEKLLMDNSMTREELDILLAGFHETVEDFWFLEDLEVAIDFYRNHEDKMLQLEEFLENIGFDDTEKQQFYAHLNKQNSTLLATKVAEWKEQLNEFQAMDQESGISDKDSETVNKFWQDFFTTTAMKPVLISIDDNGKRKELSLQDLIKQQLDTTVAIELYDKNDKLIGDAIVAQDMISSVEAVNKMVELTEVTEGLASLYAAQLPNTASPLPVILCIGYMLLLVGMFLTFRKASYEK